MFYHDTGDNKIRPLTLKVQKTLSADNTTAEVNLFKYTGLLNFFSIYGVCVRKGTLTNMTDVKFDISDGSNTSDLCAAYSTISSSFGVGGIIIRPSSSNVATQTTLLNGNQCATNGYVIPVTPTNIIAAKNTVDTNFIRFVYTTTDSPIDADLMFFIKYGLLSDDASVQVV